MYQLIGTPTNRTFRVMWAMAEMELEYTQIQASPGSDEAREFNPSGKVPALVSEGKTIIDSVAIMQYLADKHDKITFPAGTIERAQQDSFTQLINDDLDALLWCAARHSFILPQDKRVPEVKETIKWEFTRNLGILEKRMGDGPYLMGEKFTIPDIVLTHCLGWAKIAKFDLPAEGPIKDYIRRTIARPAYQIANGLRAG
ncbi:glutathione S-transferase [Amylibacter kogurei]|uniref:Glutathione S-transferase n=1 Tax=Paramylibacter kogurei TaxID=1889778 RepID=A0A2G5K0R3_9RHOB|nr:glutathione S-transferase family protein [Amylibacter kogurei]PIB23091.1 glutathione S-transferase [Amylibacter kogurei]